MQTLTEAEALANLSPCFHSTFKTTLRQKVFSNEQIIYAADLTAHQGNKRLEWGFMVLTNQRYLQITANDEDLGISYFKSVVTLIGSAMGG